MSTTNRSGNRKASSGQTKSRGQSRARQTGSRTNTASSKRSGSRTTASARSSTYRKSSRRGRRNSPNYTAIAVIGVILMIVIVSVVYGLKGNPADKKEQNGSEVMETELQKEVMVDGISITGMSREAAKAEILKNYPWSMSVRYGEDVYEIENLMAGKVDLLLDEIYKGKPKESYTLDTEGLEGAVSDHVAIMKQRWNQAARNASISGYDADSDAFVFSGEANGIVIEDVKLTADILAAIEAKDFDAQIVASSNELPPDITIAEAKEMYKTIVKYTTKTTANKKRNTNVRLAAEALNGVIVGPGQELSFNEAVGERTTEKGYQGAAAYNNGEVVEEVGGGVCQVSTTLYNAVVRAGMEISFRRSHTFEPSYVTPGMDATVSWGGPDFKFINTSSAAIGIRAKYADQTMTVSLYGIPVLEEGLTYDLQSTKIAELDPPEPTYVEDQTLQPNEEVVSKEGSMGSRWEVKLVKKKNGEIISQDVDHVASYKGHAAVIKRNTSGVVIPAETDPSGTETSDSSAAGPTGEVSPVVNETTQAVPAGTEGVVGPAAGGPTEAATTAAVAETTESPAPDNIVSEENQPGKVIEQIVAPKPEG